jgi:hypothetical protein
MKLVGEFLAIYGVYMFGSAVLICRYTRVDRIPTVIVAWLMPALVLEALIEGTFLLLFKKYPRVRPCPVGLAEAEVVVEQRRQKMFGGESLPTTFASEWARLYGVTLEKEAKKVQKVARWVLATA